MGQEEYEPGGTIPEIPEGVDPREFFSHHRERGPQRFTWTYPELAQMFGITTASVKYHQPSTIERLAQFVFKRLARRSRRITEEEMVARVFRKAEDLECWKARWPRFDLWWCGVCENHVLFAPGACPKCGGTKEAMRFNTKMQVQVRLGSRFRRLSKVLAGEPGGYVWHADGNPWNHHPSNLLVLTWEEHQARLGHRA